MLRNTLVLSIVLFLALPANFVRAAKIGSPSKAFSIKPSQDWVELPAPLQDVVVSYGKKGTLATFHITERELDKNKTVPMPINRSKAEIGAVLTTVDQKKAKVRTVEQLRWEDLFSPEFNGL